MKRVVRPSQRRLSLLVVVSALALASLACLGSGQPPTATPLPPTPVPPTEVPPTPVPPTAEPQPAQPAAAQAGTLDIVNQSNSTICYVYVSPTTSAEWGDDQLGAGNVVAPGTTFTITNVPEGTYDLRADDCDNNPIVEEFGVVVTPAGITWTISGITSTLVVVNATSLEICYLYLSSSNSGDWGPDQLGTQTLPSGMRFTLTGLEPDSYDLRVETCNGIWKEEYGLNLRTDLEFTFTD